MKINLSNRGALNMIPEEIQVAVYNPYNQELLAICRTFMSFKNWFKPKASNKAFSIMKDKVVISKRYNKEFLIKEYKETWQSQQAIIFKKVIEKN